MVWHLQDLAYLECHRVDPARREEATVRYQGDIFRIRNDEDQVRGQITHTVTHKVQGCEPCRTNSFVFIVPGGCNKVSC